MKKIIFFLLLLVCIAFPVFGINGDGSLGSPYNGPLTADMTWSGTVYVNGDVTVSGFRLTISPGAIIIFLATGADIIITGNGILTASGSGANMIRFTADFNNNGIYGETGERWGHISFQNMTPGFTAQSTINFCIVEFGQKNSSPANIEAAGGGIQTAYTYLTISNSIIRNNYAGFGGGIYVNANSSPSISNCIISNNTAGTTGGGLTIYQHSATVVTNCIIAKNSCNGGGSGGGVFVGDYPDNVRFYNCTIASNSSTSGGTNIRIWQTAPSTGPRFFNTIVWSSPASINYLGLGADITDFNYCAIQGYTTGYTSCITLSGTNSDPAGPNFTNPLISNYSITYLSPCIDKGTNTGAPVTDIIGNPRVGITDIGAYENQDFLWQGDNITNPTLWNVADNWNSSMLPAASTIIFIKGGLANYPVVNTDASVESITVASGARLTINPPYTLTVSGTITNNAGNAGIIIKSDANGNDGKLINNNSSVPGTVELYLSGGLVSPTVGTFHYFVPPVGTMAIGSTIAAVKTNLGLTNFNGDLLNYSEVAAGSNQDNGWQYFDGYNSTTPFTSINSTTGYNIYLNANDKMTFTGLLNGVDHNFNGLSFTNLGWNLVGNPYPCNYNLGGITALTGTGDGVDNTVYFNHNGGYAYWNVETGAGTTGYSNIMPPMQGFFVHVTASGQSLSLPATSKTISAAGPLRSKKGLITDSKSASDVKKIKLVLNNGTSPDETIVCLIDNATSAFDGDYDAYKLFGSIASAPSIYTELSSVKYAINSVQAPEFDSVIIPLTLELKSQGTYKIDITEFENLTGTKVTLKHGDTETPLSINTSYSFTSAAGTFRDFQLIIGYTNITTGVETHNQEKLKTWYSNNYLYINCPDNFATGKGNLVIYDIQGKMVYNNNQVSLTPGQTIQIALSLNKGLYITHVMVNNQPFVSKIVVF